MSNGELYLSNIARSMEALISVLQRQNELIEKQNSKLKNIDSTFDDLYTQVELISSLIEDHLDNVPDATNISYKAVKELQEIQ